MKPILSLKLWHSNRMSHSHSKLSQRERERGQVQGTLNLILKTQKVFRVPCQSNTAGEASPSTPGASNAVRYYAGSSLPWDQVFSIVERIPQPKGESVKDNQRISGRRRRHLFQHRIQSNRKVTPPPQHLVGGASL